MVKKKTLYTINNSTEKFLTYYYSTLHYHSNSLHTDFTVVEKKDAVHDRIKKKKCD